VVFSCGQKAYQVDKFISSYVVSMRTVLTIIELCMSGLRCLKMTV
jgi:hypothetical protein